VTSEPVPSNRTDRRRARTRAALIEAARSVFAERGVEGATIQAITDAADVAKGSFYNHFDSREDLQRAVAATALEELGAALDRDVGQRERDPARVIAASLLSTLRACLEDPALGGFLLQGADVLELGGAIGVRGRRDLQRGRRTGRFLVDDLDTVLVTLAGAGQAVLRGRLRGELGAKAERCFVALALRMLGLEAEEAGAIADETLQAFDGKAR
jgi:AcrR family transcriptional regulator